MASNDIFGDRMKAYEARETSRRFLPMVPVCARIDGRGFSKFTHDLPKPFDIVTRTAMDRTAAYLVKETHAAIGYVQSDEITLVWHYPDYTSSMIFDGKVTKLTSVLAGMATANFMLCLPLLLQERLPHFDCRVWQVPSKIEAANVILWRAQDAKRNGISSTCRSFYSAKEMHGWNQEGMLARIAAKGVNYEADILKEWRQGVYFRRETFWTSVAGAGDVERSRIARVDMPYFGNVINRMEVIFDGAAPLTNPQGTAFR